MQEEIAHIVGLTEIAKAVLALDDSIEPDELVEQLNHYLNQFENWQRGFEERGILTATQELEEEKRAELRSAIETLLASHVKVVERAEAAKAAVGEQMTGIHKRGAAMKKYIDRYPSRISITGKRKG